MNTSSRIAAATIISDEITIWKGEPFEQAMAYYSYAVSLALNGDWENVRPAIRGSLRKLHDFSEATAKRDEKGEKVAGNPNSDELAKLAAQAEKDKKGEKAKDYDFFRDAAKYVETDFALGYVIQGIAERHLKASGAGLKAAVGINPQLKPLINQIRRGAYNTILIVDYGRGPTKYNYGTDRVFTGWKPMEWSTGASLQVAANGEALSVFGRPVLDVNQMSLNHRWKNLENARKAKSTLGTAVLVGGAAVATYGGSQDSGWIGLGMMLAGLALKASAAADIRHNELLPHSTYLTVLNLPKSKKPVALKVGVADDPTSTFVLPCVWPGTSEKPAVIYLRLFKAGAKAQAPAYFQHTVCRYRNRCEPPRKGDYPYILGGNCVAPPTQTVLKAYQAGGYLRGMSVEDLRSLYREEGILFRPGPDAEGKWSNDNYRHVLEGGKVLFTPHAYTVGYKRLMYQEHKPYRPRSKRVKTLAKKTREAAAQKS